MLRFHTHAKPHPARSWHDSVAHGYRGGQRHSTTNSLHHEVWSTAVVQMVYHRLSAAITLGSDISGFIDDLALGEIL